MTGSDPREALILLHRTKLLKAFAPELDILFDTPQNNPHHIYDVGHHTAAVLKGCGSADDVLRFAALFHDAGKAEVRTTDDKGIDHFYGHPAVSAKIALQVMRRLKYSNRLIDGTVLLVKHHEEIGDAKMNMAKYLFKNQDIASPDTMKLLFMLRRADTFGQNPDTWQKKYDDLVTLEQKLSQITVYSEKDLAVPASVRFAAGRLESVHACKALFPVFVRASFCQSVLFHVVSPFSAGESFGDVEIVRAYALVCVDDVKLGENAYRRAGVFRPYSTELRLAAFADEIVYRP